jgi:hypothetical protein
MNVVDNLNSVYVINKPCISSRDMCLLPRATLHSDSEQSQLKTCRQGEKCIDCVAALLLKGLLQEILGLYIGLYGCT